MCIRPFRLSTADWGKGPWAYLIKDVEGRRLEEQEGQDEGEGQEGPLAPTQLCQGLFPDLPKSHSHLQTCRPCTFHEHQYSEVSASHW